MAYTSGYIAAGNEKLHYIKAGQGKKLLLAFHGYGNTAEIFTPFFKYLQDEYTVYSVDLPHHGKSSWTPDKPFEKHELVAMVQALQKEAGTDKFSLMGYSMGGRVCLTIMELMPESIDKVLLVAPDGLAFNPLYYFVTKTAVGRQLFNNMLTKPDKYLKFFDKLKERKWIDENRHKFAMYYLQSAPSRSFLMQVWPGMAKLVPDTNKVRRAIKQYGISVTIYMGAYDRIMPPKLAERFKKGLSTVHLHIPQKGHRVFDSDNVHEMAACLL
jgi:pimeloyl-ACP methyl ester carboxylesterase